MTKKLSTVQRAKFFRLIDATGSHYNGERVVARLRLNRFVLVHGKDACQAAYDAAKIKQAEIQARHDASVKRAAKRKAK